MIESGPPRGWSGPSESQSGLAPDHDVLVIGGGCTGVGVARDAALRGWRVALLEQRDLGDGATGNSSGMIHGGVKYLLSDRRVTHHSCLDSGYIQQTAPHLLFRIPFVIPVPASRPWAQPYLELVETFFAAYDRFQPLKNGLPHLRLSGPEVHRVFPGLAEPMVGGVVFDEWGIDTHRLVAANALGAAEAGAEILLGHRVEGLLQAADGRVVGVRERDRATGFVRERTARIVVNAAGAWSPRIAALAGQQLRLRPAKGIHLVFSRRLVNHALVVQAIDNRELFLMPHGQSTWIGTTDDDYFGDPDDAEVQPDEVEYLLGAVARLFPGIREVALLDTLVGLRPTLFRWGPYEDDLSRDFQIFDHGFTHAPGLLSIVGGKLAAYRMMAEQTVDRIGGLLRRFEPCRTQRLPLPGAEQPPEPYREEELARFPQAVLRRLSYRQGCRARQVLAGSPGDAELVCGCNGVTAAEIRHVVRHEWVRDLAQLRHRTELGAGGCGGVRCAFRAAQLVAMELGWPPHRARELVAAEEQRRWARQRPVATQEGAARLALNRMLSLAGRDLEELR